MLRATCVSAEQAAPVPLSGRTAWQDLGERSHIWFGPVTDADAGRLDGEDAVWLFELGDESTGRETKALLKRTAEAAFGGAQ